MTFSKQELLELQHLLEDYDKMAWKCGFPPNVYPRPSVRDMIRRVKQEVLAHG